MNLLDIFTESTQLPPKGTEPRTWDEMTPQQKSSGVKGRTVWNEKTRKYRTVFDVPADKKPQEPGVAEGVETPQQQQVRAAISSGLAKSSQMGKAEYQSQPTNRTYFDNAGYASDKLTGIDSIDPDGTVVISIGDTRATNWVKKLAALGGMPGVKTREVQPKLAQGVAEGPKEVVGLANFAMGGGILGGQNPADILSEKGVAEGQEDLNEGIMDSLNGIINKIKMTPGIQKFIGAAKAKQDQLIQALQHSANGKDLVANIQQAVGGQQAVAEGWGQKIGGAVAASAGGGLLAGAADIMMRAYIAMGKPDLTQMMNDPNGRNAVLLVGWLVVLGALAMLAGGSIVKKGMDLEQRQKEKEQTVKEGSELIRILKLSGLE